MYTPAIGRGCFRIYRLVGSSAEFLPFCALSPRNYRIHPTPASARTVAPIARRSAENAATQKTEPIERAIRLAYTPSLPRAGFAFECAFPDVWVCY